MSGFAKVLEERLKGFENRVAQVGWLETAQYPSGKNVAEVAVIQELGAPGASIPARPFVQPTVDENRDDWSKKFESGARAVLRGAIEPEQVLEQMGGLAAGKMRAKLGSGDFLPLSPITLMLRKWKDADPGLQVGGRLVGAAAAAVAAGEDYSLPGLRSQPLNDTGYMIASLTNSVGPTPEGKALR